MTWKGHISNVTFPANRSAVALLQIENVGLSESWVEAVEGGDERRVIAGHAHGHDDGCKVLPQLWVANLLREPTVQVGFVAQRPDWTAFP